MRGRRGLAIVLAALTLAAGSWAVPTQSVLAQDGCLDAAEPNDTPEAAPTI